MRLRQLLLTLLLIAMTAAIPVSAALGDHDHSSGSGHADDQGTNTTTQPTTTTTTPTPGSAPAAPVVPTTPAGVDLPAGGPPVLGRAVAVAPVSGEVRVRLPGASSFVALSRQAQVPTGAILDTTNGVVSLTTASNARGSVQAATFSGATFRVTQRRTSRPVTGVDLRGGSFTGCRTSSVSRQFGLARASRAAVRRLWGSGHGRFRTRGRYGSATVRGTVWLTEDRCDGTRVRVARGRVAVRDEVRHKTAMVGRGHAYLARAPR